MQFLYAISSSYDGFTPEKIKERMDGGGYLRYNWKEYFDELEEGDIIFTYFKGRGIKRGIYLISKVSDIGNDKSVKAEVLDYNLHEPLIPSEDFERIRGDILNRRGTVYGIHSSSLRSSLRRLKERAIISDIKFGEILDCYTCNDINSSQCNYCDLLSRSHLIKWRNEVELGIPSKIEAITAPFWIIPRQTQYRFKRTVTQHPISDNFYYFKTGYEHYSRLFGLGILKAIENDPRFNGLSFDYILGVPLSPDKKSNEELDRVAQLCRIVSSGMGKRYREGRLKLTHPISRKGYKSSGMSNDDFWNDYWDYLQINSNSLNNKTLLLIDDVITEGATLSVISKKIKEEFPSSRIYAATAGVMAKMSNMSSSSQSKYLRQNPS